MEKHHKKQILIVFIVVGVIIVASISFLVVYLISNQDSKAFNVQSNAQVKKGEASLLDDSVMKINKNYVDSEFSNESFKLTIPDSTITEIQKLDSTNAITVTNPNLDTTTKQDVSKDLTDINTLLNTLNTTDFSNDISGL